MILQFACVLGVVSLLFNVVQVILFRRLKKTVKERRTDVSAQELLHDLTAKGQAILRIQVLDGDNLLLRSPSR